MPKGTGRRLVWALAPVPAVVIAVTLWLPVWRHYSVREGSRVPDAAIEQARSVPSDALLDELSFGRGPGAFATDGLDVARIAEGMLSGRLDLPADPLLWRHPHPVALHLPFSGQDLEEYGAAYASFVVPRIFLAAYSRTGDEKYFDAARRFLLAAADFEQSAWIPHGLLWNDLALAARVGTLGQFWRFYRRRSDYDPATARRLFDMLASTARMLAAPSFYTYGTNHGAVQNLGLLYARLAFPTLPGVREYAALAAERMRELMPYYLNDEGVFLEHSAGYHAFGLEVTATAGYYFSLLNLPIPAEWQTRYAKALDFYAALSRPDGSLPRLGDTMVDEYTRGPRVATLGDGAVRRPEFHPGWRPGAILTLKPAAGFAVWWDGLDRWPDAEEMSQTTVTWSNYPGLTHKHADELSLLVWQGGTRWWTSSGYWEYRTPGRVEATGWNGSNAPHLVGEADLSDRHSALMRYGSNSRTMFLEIERSNSDGFRVRRQIAQFEPHTWVVLDSSEDSKSRTVGTMWMTDATNTIAGLNGPTSFVITNEEDAPFSVYLAGAAGLRVRRLRGSDSPWAGWIQFEDGPRPAPVLAVEQSSQDGWTAMVCRRGEFTSPPVVHYQDPAHWSVTLDGGRVGRDETTVTVDGAQLKLVAANTGESRQRVVEARLLAARRYGPGWDDNLPFRWKATEYLGVFFLLQEGVLLVAWWRFRRWWMPLRILVTVCWVAGGVWLHFTYLA